MSLTDKAISKIRQLIQTGELTPGARLPPEQQLASELGLSRNLMREAVKALVVARVLDVRRGDGTYVTSLEPQLLLQNVAVAVELLQGDTLLEITEVRRLFEPIATGLAATRVSADHLAQIKGHLDAMREASDDAEQLIHHDAAFHRAVVAATGNQTLTTLLEGISSQTLRARTWRGLIDANAAGRTLAEHEAIYHALVAKDANLAQAAALLHVNSSEAWLREQLRKDDGSRSAATAGTGQQPDFGAAVPPAPGGAARAPAPAGPASAKPARRRTAERGNPATAAVTDR